MEQFWQVTLRLLEGFGQNCIIFGVTLLLALPLGLIITGGSMSKFKPLCWFTRLFVWVIRGTPLMLQLFVVFFIPPLVTNGAFAFDRMQAACIAFVINYAAYFSEIYRGGIKSIPKGQYEAGQVLGMTKAQIFVKVVLFQVIKKIVPPMPDRPKACQSFSLRRHRALRFFNGCMPGRLYAVVLWLYASGQAQASFLDGRHAGHNRTIAG